MKKIDLKEKFIFDPCCSSRYMWFNKEHPNALYMDIREEEEGFNKYSPRDKIKPNIIGDFTSLPKKIKKHKFKLIVFDPPHFKGKSMSGALTLKFGVLNAETWQRDLKKSFNELWSVLDDYGILLIKFSNHHIKFSEFLKVFPEKPIIQNYMSGNGRSETKWFCFMKIPKIQ